MHCGNGDSPPENSCNMQQEIDRSEEKRNPSEEALLDFHSRQPATKQLVAKDRQKLFSPPGARRAAGRQGGRLNNVIKTPGKNAISTAIRKNAPPRWSGGTSGAIRSQWDENTSVLLV